MAACGITAFSPIHNTGSNESTRGSVVGEFIVGVLSISTVLRNGHIVLNEHIGTLNYISYMLTLLVGKLWKAYAVASCLYKQLVVYIVHNNFQYGRCVNEHLQTHRVMLEALLYFAPNIRKGGNFFSVLVCCLSRVAYVCKNILEDSTLWSTFLVPEVVNIPYTCI